MAPPSGPSGGPAAPEALPVALLGGQIEAPGMPPDAVILSGPDFYAPHITRLYGGYKRTRNLYSRVTYQKDPDQGPAGHWEAFIYWSAVDSRWCLGPHLGASIAEEAGPPLAAEAIAAGAARPACAVLLYQVSPEDDSIAPCLNGSWAANLYGTGARYQVDHMLTFEPLPLPPEAADPARSAGGYMHICARRFVDYEFPPSVGSLIGDTPPLRTPVAHRPPPEGVTWVLASDLAKTTKGPLFDESTEPRGDWLAGLAPCRGGLHATLAAAREYPGHLEMLCALSPEVSPMGMYSVWLYDIWQVQWRRITVDEYVPVARDAAEQIVPWAGGHGRSLWTSVLEKALAKLCGSYEALRRSEPAAVLMCLSGEFERVCEWRQDSGWWSQWSFQLPERKAGNPLAPKVLSPREAAHPGLHRRVQGVRPLRCHSGRVSGSWQQGSELFATVRDLHRSNALLLAYRDAGLDTSGEPNPGHPDPQGSGLVHGHGYSILGLVQVEEGEEGGGLRLVQLRNLWGQEQAWRGSWSEGSPEWDRFPEVRRHHLRPEHQVTGRFWMAWADFLGAFDRLEVCPMPAAARKASYVPRQLRRRRSNGAPRGQAASRAAGLAAGLLGWRCCAVERARG